MLTRRVTFDRAVWTKPLAFAADAVKRLWASERGDHRRVRVPDRRASRGARADGRDACDGRGWWPAMLRARRHLRRFARACAPSGGWRAGDGAYELS